MNLLPQNPKARQTVLLLIVGGVVLLGFGFFFITYFTPATPEEIQQIQAEKAAQGKNVSEGQIRKLEGGITALKAELGNDFYKTLRKRSVSSDAAMPGKKNPFK